MYIPINGRIAIVDDEVTQALPLIRIFSQKNIPFTYYTGAVQDLPEPETLNDIRVLILDLNLDVHSTSTQKQVPSKIYGVIDRLISCENIPYILIYWSREETKYEEMLNELFKNGLKDKKPITFFSLTKSDYFDLEGKETEDFDKFYPQLLTRVQSAFDQIPIFNLFISWENLIHRSADYTIKELLKDYPIDSNWNDNTKFVFHKLAKSFAGISLDKLDPVDKIKNGFYSLNYIFNDSLENSISTDYKRDGTSDVVTSIIGPRDNNIIYALNKKFLFSSETSDKLSPGIIFKNNGKHNYGEILNFSADRKKILKENELAICEKIKEFVGDVFRKKKKMQDEIFDEFKSEVKRDWITVEVNVTPICDYAQKKCIYYRILPGLLINSKYSEYIIKNTEALFVSPSFNLSGTINGNYFLLLDFRLFTSMPEKEFNDLMIPLLRIRQAPLSEIQSKLARHINRQGILFLE